MASQDGTPGSEANQPLKTTPKDALVMASILKEMGVNEYEPRVINQMVEFAYRYVTDVVEDARVYCQHANRKTLNIEDVKLAVSQKLDHAFTSPPPREFLLEIARSKNSLPLPLITDRSGLRLPPERYCLTGNNYKVKAPSKKSSQQQQRKNSAKSTTKSSTSTGATPATTSAKQSQQKQSQESQPKSDTTTTSAGSVQNTANTDISKSNIQNQSFGLSNLLKRKHEDDDYDA